MDYYSQPSPAPSDDSNLDSPLPHGAQKPRRRAKSAPTSGEDLDGAVERLLRPEASVEVQQYAAGDFVVRADGRRCCGLARSGVPWVLDAGEVATVTCVDETGDFCLKNTQGVESTWQFAKNYLPQVRLRTGHSPHRHRSPSPVGQPRLYNSAAKLSPFQAAHSTPHSITLT
eukprot:Hpha_TRINITY_DN5921_c0_g1::TRINITY_DN5921_c0_g1_i1::g.147241::m.147241